MKAETWLPILTLVLGWGLAHVTEVWRDRRIRDRDRQARQAELQRPTLLALQDAMLELFALMGPVRRAFWGYVGSYRDESIRSVSIARRGHNSGSTAVPVIPCDRPHRSHFAVRGPSEGWALGRRNRRHVGLTSGATPRR